MPSYNIYSNCTNLATGCILYQNSNGTSTVSAGYYFDGTTCWFATSDGSIVNSTACPTPTPTPTNTITPTVTPTVTPTPTTQGFSVGVYAACDFVPTGSTVRIWYKIGAGADTLLASISTNQTSCNLRGTITGISSGSNVKVGLSYGLLSPTCDAIPFNATSGTTTCPAGGTTYCGFDEASPCFEYPINFTVTSNTDLAIGVDVLSNGTILPCL